MRLRKVSFWLLAPRGVISGWWRLSVSVHDARSALAGGLLFPAWCSSSGAWGSARGSVAENAKGLATAVVLERQGDCRSEILWVDCVRVRLF